MCYKKRESEAGRRDNMRDYQKKKNNPWRLPKYLYKQTLNLIRDYHRLKEEYEDALHSSPQDSSSGRSSMPGDPTGAKVIKLEKLHERIQAIEKAKREIPEVYMQGVWNSIVHGAAYPEDADRTTYWRYKAKFVYQVAENMHWK